MINHFVARKDDQLHVDLEQIGALTESDFVDAIKPFMGDRTHIKVFKVEGERKYKFLYFQLDGSETWFSFAHDVRRKEIIFSEKKDRKWVPRVQYLERVEAEA